MSAIAEESVVLPAISEDESTVMEQAATAFRARFTLGQLSSSATRHHPHRFALLTEPFCPPPMGRRREWIRGGSLTTASWHACVDA